MRFIKSIVCVLLTLTVSMPFVTMSFADTPTLTDVSARSAILIDADSGSVLYQKNAHARMGMASTTKIMTALTVLSLSDVSRSVTVPREAVGTEGSSVYLCEGESLTVGELLYALLLASANDAAVALAVVLSGSVEKFSEQMNLYAESLGLSDTHFTNPHGLSDSEHYTTAYDLALISREALKNDTLREIFSTYKKTLPMCGEADKRLVVNHNKLLRSYDGAIGIKTGFTKATGRCLVSAALRDGLTLICVTLDAPDDWRDHTALLDHGFDSYERRMVADAGELEFSLPAVGGESDSVTLTNTSPMYVTVKKGERVEPEYVVLSSHRFMYAPVLAGYEVGTVSASCNGSTDTCALTVAKSVPSAKHKSSIFNFFKNKKVTIHNF